MLASRLGSFEGLAVADLFAGSGALGLEALSRGAAHCLFVERDPAALKALRRNVAGFDARQHVTIDGGSVFDLRKRDRPFDLLVLDPPYNSGAGEVALDRLARLGWIAPSSWIALETSRDERIRVESCRLVVERNVGRAKVTLFTGTPDPGQ